MNRDGAAERVVLDEATFPDPRDRRRARSEAARVGSLLAAFNAATIIEAADVHVARRLGVLGGESDERVLLAVALAVRAARSGSVCVDLARVAGSTQGSASLTWPEPGAWAGTVSSSRLVAAGALEVEGTLLYLRRYWAEEVDVVADLTARASNPAPAVDEYALGAALALYFADPDYADQLAAAEKVCRQWTTVLTGGPGSGKTTTVARLLGVLHTLHAATNDRPLRVALAAPTGKAAARMVQAVADASAADTYPDHPGVTQAVRGLQATTLHRLLGWRPDSTTRFRHDRSHPLPHDVVIVDETSMVSLTMMARLIEAMRPGARLVLVGDADQLASVDAGAVLKDLVDGYGEAPASPVARLSTNRRFGAEIGDLADAIRSGEADSAVALLRAGSTHVQWLAEAELSPLLAIHAAALADAARQGDTDTALAHLGRHRLLCAHRSGPFGIRHWNRHVERLLAQASGRDWLPDWYAGRAFVVSGNDYGLNLWNGDTGVACFTDGQLRAYLDQGAGVDARSLSVNRLADIETAHAMTVHRSQGSQFNEVTVLLPEPESRILTRELFYTAVTRAQEKVRVVGSEASVRAAVTRQATRATGLAQRLSP